MILLNWISIENLTLNEEKIDKIFPLFNHENYIIYFEATHIITEAVKRNNSPDLVPKLKKIAQDKNKPWKTRIGVAQALGSSGYDVKNITVRR